MYYDYRFKFLITQIALALLAMEQLRLSKILPLDRLPENMLGDWRDSTGAIVTQDATWIGRQGVTGKGDPLYYYVAIRSDVPPTAITFNPATYGLLVCDPAENAAVLGVWE